MSRVPIAAPMPQGSVEQTPQARAIFGGPASGKTQALVEEACALANGGAAPEQILVFAATPDAAHAFQTRLLQACPQAVGVRVTTAREWCLKALAMPEAQAWTGRDARLLAPFECDVLMEDMRRLGIRPRRLGNMMAFFHKSMTELADDEDGAWLVTDEERIVFHTLKDRLRFTRGIIEPELANLCVRFLQANEATRARLQVDHVLVDDYQMLSRASQVVANLAARDSIAIACDPAGCLEVFDSYPYAAGIAEFMEANPSAEQVRLTDSNACEAGARIANGLLHTLDPSAEALAVRPGRGEAQLRELVGVEPADEVNAVVAFIKKLIAAGMAPDDIVVASPHPTWTANLARALRAEGIAAEASYDDRIVSGDYRSLEKCCAARMLTGLSLVADSHDALAWRSWCGFGDEHASAGEVDALRSAAARDGATFDAILEAGASDAVAPHIAEAYSAGCAIIEQAQGLQGQDILAFLAQTILGEGEAVPASIALLCAEMPDGSLTGDSAPAMAARARARLAAPAFEHAGRVRIANYERMVGLRPKAVLLCGFVNGLFPDYGYFADLDGAPEKAERQHEHDMRLMAQVASKPSEILAVSYFEQVPSKMAEKLRLKLRRVCLKDKKPIALIEPSEYLERFKA